MIQPTPIRAEVRDDEPERPEEEQMRGILPIRIGSETRYVPTLKRARSREWKRLTARDVASIDIPEDDPVAISEFVATLADDLIFGLVVAFDHTNALDPEGKSTADYLDEHADDRDIHDALDVMMRSVSPKDDDPVAGFVAQITLYFTAAWSRLEKAREQSETEKPTSGSPGPTAGTLNRSMRRSRTSSTTSSGTTAKKRRSATPRTDAT